MSDRKTPYRKIMGPGDLGFLLRQVRKERGLTQKQLADRAGVGPRLIGEVERGKATAEIGKVFRLLASLGMVVSVQPTPPEKVGG